MLLRSLSTVIVLLAVSCGRSGLDPAATDARGSAVSDDAAADALPVADAPVDATPWDAGVVPPPDAAPGTTRFAVIGDFGSGTPDEGAVADLVKSLQPDFVLTVGDNNYPFGAAETIDANIGQFYQEFIFPYVGEYGSGATRNRFFPSLGNHDWDTANAQPYFDYFTLPGNERYYELFRGGVHFFALDSDPREPDGTTVDSVQASWLRERITASHARWRIVFMHHAPYSSGPHGSTLEMRWPFREWGADLVLSGHDHNYERLEVDGLTYIVNGLGGMSMYGFNPPLPGSVARYASAYGALLVEVTRSELRARFFSVHRQQIDEVRIPAQR